MSNSVVDREKSGYVFSSDSIEASSTTQYESSDEPEVVAIIETQKSDIDSG